MKLFGTLMSSDNTYLSVQYSAASTRNNAQRRPMQVKGAFNKTYVFAEWRWVRTNFNRVSCARQACVQFAVARLCLCTC